jgi:hypothetical protein
MITQQKSAGGKAQRRENPNKVACPHRLTFAFSNDEEAPRRPELFPSVTIPVTLTVWDG